MKLSASHSRRFSWFCCWPAAWLALVIIIPLLLPVSAKAQDAYVKEISYRLEQPFGGESEITSLAQYIQLVYQFALGLVGIIAVVLIMFGGSNWIMAAGNEQAITSAKDTIKAAVLGLIIALLSYVILLVINPRLLELNFQVIQIPIPGAGGYIWQVPYCGTGASLQGSCSTNSGTKACTQVACGETGIYEGTVCQGVLCPVDKWGYGQSCYRNVNNVEGPGVCQMKECADKFYSCYSKYSKESESNELKKCLCEFYPEEVYPRLKLDYKNYATSTAQQQTEMKLLCNESTTQEGWVKLITDNNVSTPYTAGPLVIENNAWNCGFSCQDTIIFDPSTGKNLLTCDPK